MTTEIKEINIHDIDKLTDNFVSFIADNIPNDKQNLYINMLYNTINNMYKLLINSNVDYSNKHRTNDLITYNAGLKQENEKLRQALKSVEESINDANGEVQSAESYLMTASTTIDNLNLDD